MFRFSGLLPALLCAVFLLLPAAARAAGPGPTVAIGDVNGDGTTDMVALDPGNGQLDIVTVDAAGDFTLTTQDLSDIGAMSSLALADVNRDGWLDVVISDQSDATQGVRVLLNNGDGSFAADVAYPTQAAAGPGPVSVTVADLNDDGWPDLVTANGSSGDLSVLINKGDGTFAAPVSYPAGGNPVAVAAGDLNGDGFTDLAVADLSGNAVLVLLNDGSGALAAPQVLAVGAAPVTVTLVDMDGDGRLDMAVANRDDNTAALLHGHGDGGFDAAQFYATGVQPGWIGAQDLNGDGRPELVTDNYSDGSVSLFANNGDGSLTLAQTLYPDFGSYNTVLMDVQGSTQLVSADLQVASVVVMPVKDAVSGGSGSPPPQSTVRHVQGAHDPQASNGGGALDVFSLMLGLGALRRRLRAGR